MKEGPIIPELFINGKDAVSVCNVDEFKGHRSSASHGIQVTAGGAKPAVASKRDKLKLTAVRAAIHSTAKGRVAAVDHLIDIFHLRDSGMKSIFNFFIMVGKDFL